MFFIVKKISLTILLLFIFGFLNAQDLPYARHIVDTLSSAYFEGRGAVNEGETKAAKFIADEFKKWNLTPFGEDYFQKFRYPINTFYGNLNVALDHQKLIPGKDYIVGADSHGIDGTFNLIWYNKNNIPNKKQLKKLTERRFFENKFIVLDNNGIDKDDESYHLLKINTVEASGIIFLEDKLTKDLSSTYEDYAILKILRGAINRKNKSIQVTINQKFISGNPSQNVIGFVKGTSQPDSFIVISAHYDHLGRMGNPIYFPGANDNASGIAFLLNWAKYYSENPSKYSIVLMAFGVEEAGLLGSKYFIDHPLFDLKTIKFEINLDVIGTGSEGITVVNGAVYPKYFDLLLSINKNKNYLPTINKRGKAANSDHYWFSEKEIPAFFIYANGGIKAYHDIYDVSKTLPLTAFNGCFLLIRDFISEL